jgi:hypothetical protein
LDRWKLATVKIREVPQSSLQNNIALLDMVPVIALHSLLQPNTAPSTEAIFSVIGRRKRCCSHKYLKMQTVENKH